MGSKRFNDYKNSKKQEYVYEIETTNDFTGNRKMEIVIEYDSGISIEQNWKKPNEAG